MMTLLRNPRFLTSFACALLFSSALIAEVPSIDSQDKTHEEHVVVGSRPLHPEKLAKIEAQQLQRAYEIENPKALPTSEIQSYVNRAYYKADGKPAFRLASAKVNEAQFTLASFPVSCHWVSWRSPDSRFIKIEDGSTWELASGDYATLNSWRNDEPLFITPVTSWFVSQQYYITNKTNNTYIKANLVDGPVAFGPYSHWVTGVDPVQGHVFLENQSVWCVDPNDLHILSDRRNNNDWAANDHIIIILHDNRYSAYDHILINVNQNCKVHAKAY